MQAKPHRAKRRKTNTGKAAAAANRGVTRASTSLSVLFDLFQHGLTIHTAPSRENVNDNELESSRNEIENQAENDGFESTIDALLPEYLEARQLLWAQSSAIPLPVCLLPHCPRRGTHIHVCFVWTCQDDNNGVGSGELVRPLSRLETPRFMALAKQRMIGHVTSPSEWVVLRKLQLQQVGVAVNWVH